MNLNQTVTMGNSFKSLNLTKKLGVSLFLVILVVYLVLSVKFILS